MKAWQVEKKLLALLTVQPIAQSFYQLHYPTFTKRITIFYCSMNC